MEVLTISYIHKYTHTYIYTYIHRLKRNKAVYLCSTEIMSAPVLFLCMYMYVCINVYISYTYIYLYNLIKISVPLIISF